MLVMRYHNGHIVKCPSCSSTSLRLAKKIMNVMDNEFVQYYRCANCGIQFRCCPTPSKSKYKRHTINPMLHIADKLKHYRYLIKQLEQQIDSKSY